jgi:hypothetical protein
VNPYGDPADSPRAKVDPVYPIDDIIDIAQEAILRRDAQPLIDWACEQYEAEETMRFSAFVAELFADNNPALNLWAYAFAFGFSFTEGKSQADVAKTFNVTRAALSKRVCFFKKKYGCRSRNMKSDQAVESYRRDKLTNHHRYQDIYDNHEQDSSTEHQ